MVFENDYLETQVMTSPPYRLHLMVIDEAIRKARIAIDALEQQEHEASHFALDSCRQCVNELIGGLDPETSPDLVERLKSLFLFVYRRLVAADLEHDPSLVREALRILESHRDTWVALLERLKHSPSSAAYETDGMSWMT